MPDKRRKSKNWKMSKKNARIKAMRMRNRQPQTAAAPTTRPGKNHKAVVIQSKLLSSAKGAESNPHVAVRSWDCVQ